MIVGGVVVSARRARDGRPVLLWRWDGSVDVDAIARLEREALDRSTLGLPGVLEVLDVHAGDDEIFVATEDFGGVSIGDVGQRVETVEDRLGIALALVEALGALHEAGFVEGELSPEEILVNPETSQVRLLALGAEVRARRGPSSTARAHAFRAPECWLRGVRAADARSDLYSVGALLYQLFTDCPAFSASDLPGFFHEHLARRPSSPSDLVPGLPTSLSGILLRLLEKEPERRYQSGRALAFDLERCRADLETGGSSHFEPGETDWARNLRVPPIVVGRDAERRALFTAFERVAKDRKAELHLVRGAPGIGKTSLIRSLELPVLLQGGWFAVGKLEQLGSDPPLAGVERILRHLVSCLLMSSEVELEELRREFREAERLAAVLVERFDSLRLVFGDLPPASPLPVQEALARQTLAIRQFLRVIASRLRPLVLFIDDLQWADVATLELVETLLSTESDLPLLLVLAYREGEVSETLASALEPLREMAREEWDVGPLDATAAANLLAGTFKRDVAEVEELAADLIEVSSGNPLLLRRQLMALHERGALQLDSGQGWRWKDRHKSLASRTRSPDLQDQLRGMTGDALDVLQRGALMSGDFRARDVARLLGLDRARVEDALAKAIDAGLVVSTRDGYEFAHDQLQEAVLESMDEESFRRGRAEVGRLFLERYQRRSDPGSLFSAVGALDDSFEALDPAEKGSLVGLNLDAARVAKRSGSWVRGLELVRFAASILPDDSWSGDYEQTFAVHRELCELMQLRGDAEAAAACCAKLLERARNNEDRATVYSLLISQNNTRGLCREAIEGARQALALVGIDFPDADDGERLEAELRTIESLVAGRPVESLLDAPTGGDPRARIGVELLGLATPALFIARPNLLPLCVAIMTRLSLESGNVAYSAYAYAFHGFLLAARQGAHLEGVRWAELGVRLARELADPVQICRTTHLMAFFLHTVRPYREAEPLYLEGFEAGAQGGDPEFAGYQTHARAVRLFVEGRPLAEIRSEVERGLAYTRSTGHTIATDILEAVDRAVRFHCGEEEAASFAADDASELIERWTVSGSFFAIFVHRTLQAHALVQTGQYTDAIERVVQAREFLGYVPNSVLVPFLDVVEGVCRSRVALDLEGVERAAQRGIVEARRDGLESLAGQCAANFGAKAALLRASVALFDGDSWRAAEFLDRAGVLAEKEGLTVDALLAYRGLAEVWENLGKVGHAAEARDQVRRAARTWGAGVAAFGREDRSPSAPRRTSALEAAIDAATIARVSRALARPRGLDEVVNEIMSAVVEHAGARRGVLVLEEDGEWRVSSVRSNRGKGVSRTSVPLKGASGLVAVGLVQMAIRTGTPVLVDDAREDPRLVGSPRVLEVGVRSVLALPLSNRGRVLGVVYLENDLVPGAFDPEKVGLLELVGAQGAISLENARLYSRLAESEGQFRATFEQATAGIAVCGLDGRFQRANECFQLLAGYDEEELRSMSFVDLTHAEDLPRERSCFEELVAGEIDQYTLDKRLLRQDGSVVWVEVGVSTRCEDGRPVQLVAVVVDIDGRKRAKAQTERQLKENETLLRELHHRVKNNLQVVSSLLLLQARRCAEPLARRSLKASQERIQAMLSVHEALYRSNDFSRVDFAEYLRRLAKGLTATYLTPPARVAIHLEVTIGSSSLDEAIPCGLLVSELITNALKYAFPNEAEGTIRVRLENTSPGRRQLTVEDDGVGFSGEARLDDEQPTLGLQLIEALAGQLGGRPLFHEGPGTRFTLEYSV